MTFQHTIPPIDLQRTQIFPFLEDAAGPKTPFFIHTFNSYVHSWNNQTHAGQRYLVCWLLARPLTDFYTGRWKCLLPLITAVRLYGARAHCPGYVRARSRAVQSERYGGGRSHWLRYHKCAVNFYVWRKSPECSHRNDEDRRRGHGRCSVAYIRSLAHSCIFHSCAPKIVFILLLSIINWRFELQTDGDCFFYSGGWAGGGIVRLGAAWIRSDMRGGKK